MLDTSFAITMVWLSSLSLALMVIFDRLMVGDCYRNRPEQAWFVASVSGTLFGLTATGIAWLLAPAPLAVLWTTTVDLLWPYGLLVTLAGACAVQVLRHYFQAFVPENGGEVNEAAIAMWLASTPLWIFSTIIGLTLLETELETAYFEHAEVSGWFALAVATAVLGFSQFERSGAASNNPLRPRYYRAIVLVLTFSVLYTLILSAVLHRVGDGLITTLALLPFYWIGFGAGVRVLTNQTERQKLRRNWRRIKVFWFPIVVAETIGMAVFFFEFFGLSEVDPTLVNLIIGAHVAVVYLAMNGLRLLRRRLERQGIRRIWLLGLRFSARRLPQTVSGGRLWRELSWLTLALIALAGGLYLVSE